MSASGLLPQPPQPLLHAPFLLALALYVCFWLALCGRPARAHAVWDFDGTAGLQVHGHVCSFPAPADMLPRGVREKLLLIAQHVKAKHRAQAEAAAAEAATMAPQPRGLLAGLNFTPRGKPPSPPPQQQEEDAEGAETHLHAQ